MINFPIYEEIPEPYFQDLKNGMMAYGKTVTLTGPVICITDSLEEQDLKEKERKELETKVNQCLAALHESCK